MTTTGNLMNVALSGLQAYRTALGVTGENIANVETEGYHRRDTVQEELRGAQPTAFVSGTSGQGVRVTDIRRAFDALLADRARDTGSALSAAETYLPAIEQLEERMTPGLGGPIDSLDKMFNAMTGAAVAPDDIGLRNVLIEAADAFAASVRDLAADLTALSDSLVDRATKTATMGTEILRQLAETQEVLNATGDSAARNSILDRRDKLLSDLAGIVEISVTLDDRDMATVTLGDNPQGPILLERGRAATLTVTETALVEVTPGTVGASTQTRIPSGGQVQGLYDALGVVADTLVDLNDWARGLAAEINAVHANGVDLDGQAGGDIFSLDGYAVTPAVINRGTAYAEVELNDGGPAPSAPMLFVFDGAEWQGTDGDGNAIGAGAGRINLPGLSVNFYGDAEAGDALSLSPTDGAALNMTLVLDDPRRIAAAGSVILAAAPENTGTGVISAAPSRPDAPEGVTDLSTIFGAAPNGTDAVTFLQGGAVGVIPAGAGSATLYSLGQQSQMQFPVGTGAAGGSPLNVTVDGVAYSFDLTTIPAWGDLDGLATALNGPDVMTGDELTLGQAGVFASVQDGALTLTAGSGTIDAATFAGTAAAVTEIAADGSDVRVFTREGRQLSGPPLTPEEAAAFITQGNGFVEGATYDTSLLNRAEGYRALTQTRANAAGDYRADIGATYPVVTWSGTVPAPADPISDVSLWLQGDAIGTVTLPQGSSAKRAAETLSDAFPVAVTASTRVMLEIPDDGAVSFSLEGDNLTPLALNTTISGGDLGTLTDEINTLSGQTGIRAELSPDRSHILLSHDQGETITLSRFTHSAGGAVNLTRVDDAGAAIEGATTLGGATGVDAARLRGVMTLTSPQEFDITVDGIAATTARDTLQSGMVMRQVSQAGGAQAFTFAFDPAIDASQGDGVSSLAGGAQYDMAIDTGAGDPWAVTVTSLSDDLQTNADVAAAIAAAYREDAPSSRITGRALTALPADGLGTSVFLGDQRYDLLVEGGEITVTGPEDGRVTAYFDGSNQLVVETVGGSVNGDALRLGDVPRNAVAFGVDSVTRDLIGTAVDFDTLPAGANSFDMVVDGTTHSITVTRAGGNVIPSVPADFPGAVAYDAGTQQITFTLNDPTVSVDIPPSEIATSAGFQTAGATLSVVEGELILQSTDGRVLHTDITASSLADNRITLNGLPDEELLVFMSDTGALGLAGAVDIPADPPLNGPVELRVLDGARGLVEMVDIASGASIATRVLDDTGSATLGGFSVTLSGQLNTGDRFTISPNTDGTGDARNLETIGDMRLSDPDEGVGGFAVLYNRLLTDVAAKVTGAETREETATALKQGADRDVAKGAAVDLDVEAANLMTQQQAYQANAQVIQVARQLFDTLINSL